MSTDFYDKRTDAGRQDPRIHIVLPQLRIHALESYHGLSEGNLQLMHVPHLYHHVFVMGFAVGRVLIYLSWE